MLILLNLVPETISVVLSFLAVKTNRVLLVVVSINFDKIKLVLERHSLDIEKFSLIRHLISSILNLVLVLKEVFWHLVTSIFCLFDSIIHNVYRILHVLLFHLKLLKSDDFIFLVTLNGLFV